jgi:hypothetical protein
MGHVPTTSSNRSKMLETKNDSMRKNAKNHMVYTVEHNLPGYAGFKPHSVNNDKGPTYPGIDTTHTRSFVRHSNIIDDKDKLHNKRSMILKSFFTEPKNSSAILSADGCADAQTFFKKYRPHEALMKSGAPESSKWIGDIDLKRSYIYTSAS